MSNVTPPVPAALERDTVKVNEVVPLLPSIWTTSLTNRLGGVGVACGVSEKSSTDSPSSEPGARSLSVHRTENVAPLGMLSPPIDPLIAVRFGDTLPFRAPTVPATTGLAKSSESTSVQ